MIRAVEVIRLTGKPFSHSAQLESSIQCPESRSPFFALSRSAADLRARIDARVEQMFQRGLVEETRHLLERGLAQNQTAMQAIGYRQVVEHLRGERSLADTIELVRIRTRQFAQRQVTWFRKQSEIIWLELSATNKPAAVAKRMCGFILPHARDTKE